MTDPDPLQQDLIAHAYGQIPPSVIVDRDLAEGDAIRYFADGTTLVVDHLIYVRHPDRTPFAVQEPSVLTAEHAGRLRFPFGSTFTVIVPGPPGQRVVEFLTDPSVR